MYINGLTFPVLFSRVYWPLFVLIFYVLSPIPTFISRRLSDGDSSSNACRELAYFLTTGIVVSSFGLPIVLARKETVGWPCPRYIKSCLCHSHCKFVESFNRRDRIQCDSCVFFFTDSVGCLWSGDDRKRRHLPHNFWLLRRVWRRRWFQLGAVVESV